MQIGSCWEMYPNFAANRSNPRMLTRSHCHAWSAAPGYFLGAYVLGVRKEANGWKRVCVAPEPGDLKWARGTVPLPDQGRIDVSWRIIEESGTRIFDLEVRAPGDIQIDLAAPKGFTPSLRRLEV